MKIKRSKRISFVRWTTIKENTRKRHYGFKNGYSDVFFFDVYYNLSGCG